MKSASDQRLEDLGIPRTNYAPDCQNPEGTTEYLNWRENHKHQTVLQQHIAFFDPDNDGIIAPWDTFSGLRRIGWNFLLSLVAALIIHGPFSYPTCPTWIPDPFFRIYIANIHKDKHGSDTNTYDHEGDFVPQKFEDWWKKYGKIYGGEVGVTKKDLLRAWRGQACLADFFGQAAEAFEWTATYIALWPEDGILRKEECRKTYDGSIFYQLEEKENARRQRMANGRRKST